MSNPERPHKISKQMRHKAQEFLEHRDNFECLMDIVRHFEAGQDLSSCLLTLEMIFTTLLKDKSMYVEVIPLKPAERTHENQYKERLKEVYGWCYEKILACLCNESPKIQIQGLSTAMGILSHEGKYPLDVKGQLECYVPLNRLKAILMKLLSNDKSNANLINKYTEYLQYDDVLFFTWKVLPSLTAKCNPNEQYILNFLFLFEKLQVEPNAEPQFLCGHSGDFFTFNKNANVKAMNKMWHCVMLWDHTPETHKKLLIVLLEKVLKHLDKPLLLTDFLMDSLDVGGPVSLLALQGIFTMIQVHNLDYPNIFAKLYSMFEPEIFHTKYKARLFHLSDLFLSSTHLPENLVAAFAKRLARLALIAPPEDIVVICMFISNLILRHPGLKCLLNHASADDVISNDPYIVEERDPTKSNAINSSLWEIQSLQQHVIPRVAIAARFISSPLPSTEHDLSQVLDTTGDDMFDREIKKKGKLIAMAFHQPTETTLSRDEKVLQYWNI